MSLENETDRERWRPAAADSPQSRDQDWVFLRRLLITFGVAGAVYFLWAVSDVFLLVFAAILVGILLNDLADFVARKTPIPRNWSLLLSTTGLVLLCAGFLLLFGGQLAGQVSQLVQQFPQNINAAGERLGFSNAAGTIRETLDSGSRTGIVTRAAGYGYTFVGIIADIALVIIAGIYLAASPEVYRKGAVKLLPPGQHDQALAAMDATGHALSRWFQGQLITMCIVGLASFAAYWMIGLPSPLALGLIAGITNFVPFVGPIIGAVPAMVIAMVTDMESLLWTIAAVLVIQQIEGNVITPIVQKHAVAIPPAVILFAIVVFGIIFGWLGIFLAVPLAVSVSVLIKKLWIRETLGEQVELPGEKSER